MALQRKTDGTLWLTDPTGARAPVMVPNSAEGWLNNNGFDTGAAETVPEPLPEPEPIPEPAKHPMSVVSPPDGTTAVGRYKMAMGQLDAPFVRAEAQALGPQDRPLGAEPTGADASLDTYYPEGMEPPSTPPAPGQPPAPTDFYNTPNFAPPPRGSNVGTALEGDAGTTGQMSSEEKALLDAQGPALPDLKDVADGVITKTARDIAGVPDYSQSAVDREQGVGLSSGPEPPPSASPAPPLGGVDLADNKDPPAVSPGQGGQPQSLGGAFGQDVRQKALEEEARSGQGSPGRKAYDELQSTKVERKESAMSPETAAAYEAAVGQQMGIAQQTGEMQQQAHRIAGLRAAEAADASRAQAVELQRQQATKQKMLSDRMAVLDRELDQVRKSSKENPVERYWARKGGFGTVMTKIGIALGALGSAITKQPNLAYQQVRDEINDEINFQKNFLETNSSIIGKKMAILGEMRSQMMSPEAAESATRALLLEGTAQEATAQAMLLNSEQARAAGLTLAAKLQADALQERAKAELGNEAVITQLIKHHAAQAASGGKPFNRIDVAAKVSKQTGVPFEQVYAGMLADQYPTGKSGAKTSGEMTDTRETLRRTVVIPPMLYDPTTKKMVKREVFGYPQVTYAYSGEKAEGGAPWARAQIVEGGQYIRNLDRMIDLIEKNQYAAAGGFLGKTRGELKNLISFNAGLLKQTEIREALTSGEYKEGVEWKNLTGDFALDTLTPTSTKLARLQQLRNYAVQRRAGAINPLMRTRDDPTSVIGESTQAVPGSAKKVE